MSSSAGPRPFTELGARVILDDVRVTGPTELETSAGERIEADRIVFAGGTRAVASADRRAARRPVLDEQGGDLA